MAITEIYIGRIDKHKDNNGATPVTVYRIEDITTEEAEILTSEILCNPVSEKAFVNQFPANGHDTLEIGLIPGVMNPVEETLMNAAKDLGITPKAVGTSTLYVFDRKISKKKKLEIQNELLSQVKQVIEENGEMFVIIVKVETHNGPVALEPEGGSETKVGGDERDVVATGKGGELLFMIVMNNFGEPELDESFVMEGCLHPRKHLIGNTNGESSYGNKTGVPTLMNNQIGRASCRERV